MTKGYLQRKAAWEVLLKVNSGIYSHLALEKVLKNYKFNYLDIAFITELSFGCIRNRTFLDFWIDHTSRLPYQKQPPKLRWLLHIGLYQLLKMDRVPNSASISTTVEIAKQTNLRGLSGTVNAILRNAINKLKKKELPIKPKNDLERIAFYNSIPFWLVKEMIDWFGVQDAENIAKAFNKKPSIDLRINSLNNNTENFLKILKQNNIDAKPIKNLVNGIELITKPRSIKNLPCYEDGGWVVQDRSSQWVAPLLNPKEGERILDLCSAPGSKTTHIAELIKDDGEIWAIDRSEIRLKILRSNLNRLNIKSVKVLKADATKLLDKKPEFEHYFDKVLIDAPCSGIGTFSRNPDARWFLNQAKIEELVLLQEKLLENSFKFLRNNGAIVYSTCTICPRENNLLIRKFLKYNPGIKLKSERQILPSLETYGDGFYAAILTHK